MYIGVGGNRSEIAISGGRRESVNLLLALKPLYSKAYSPIPRRTDCLRIHLKTLLAVTMPPNACVAHRAIQGAMTGRATHSPICNLCVHCSPTVHLRREGGYPSPSCG